MAAAGHTASGTGDQPARRVPSALARLLTAAIAGGAVLLLWGGSAGAAGSEAPEPPPPASSDGLLGGLIGDGGALTPAVELVDETTSSLVGSKPVGETTQHVSETVDPIVAPVTTPVTDAADPVLAPVLDTVGEATGSIIEPVTASIPPALGTPGAPIDPTDPTSPLIPPIVDPTGSPLPELPPLLPLDPTTDPGTSPGDGSNPPTTIGSPVVGSSTPLAIVAFTSDRTGAAAAIGDVVATHLASAAIDDSAHPSIAASSSHGPEGDPARSLPAAEVPAPCAGPGRTVSSAGPAPAFLAASAATTACAGTLLDVPTSPPPARAPAAGPEVAPD